MVSNIRITSSINEPNPAESVMINFLYIVNPCQTINRLHNVAQAKLFFLNNASSELSIRVLVVSIRITHIVAKKTKNIQSLAKKLSNVKSNPLWKPLKRYNNTEPARMRMEITPTNEIIMELFSFFSRFSYLPSKKAFIDPLNDLAKKGD